MKRFITALLMLLSLRAVSETVRLMWDANPEPDIVRYVVHYGPTSGNYLYSQTVTTNYAQVNVGPGTWYFVVTAVNTSGLESMPSNEITDTIPNEVTINQVTNPAVANPIVLAVTAYSEGADTLAGGAWSPVAAVTRQVAPTNVCRFYRCRLEIRNQVIKTAVTNTAGLSVTAYLESTDTLVGGAWRPLAVTTRQISPTNVCRFYRCRLEIHEQSIK